MTYTPPDIDMDFDRVLLNDPTVWDAMRRAPSRSQAYRAAIICLHEEKVSLQGRLLRALQLSGLTMAQLD